MKKARFMLLAIAIIGVVGGALAFKSSKSFGGSYYLCTTTTVTGPTVCISGYTTIPVGTGVSGYKVRTSTITTGACSYVTNNLTYWCTTPTTVYTAAGE